jgi:hypothetical protein
LPTWFVQRIEWFIWQLRFVGLQWFLRLERFKWLLRQQRFQWTFRLRKYVRQFGKWFCKRKFWLGFRQRVGQRERQRISFWFNRQR